MIDIRSYFPKVYDGIREIEELSNCENSLLNELDNNVDRVTMNQYIISADEDTIREYEKIFNISSRNYDLDFRRQMVLNRLSTKVPFTMNTLKSKLDDIIGKDNYKVWVDYENFTLYVESFITEQRWSHELYVTINMIKPANIVFINKPVISNSIKVAEQLSYSEQQYNYKLGVKWKLGVNPFRSINDKGVIKMLDGKSINDNLLNRLKAETINQISYVRINNTLVINQFTIKTVENNVATISYTVSKTGGITEVNKVELFSVDNSLLSTINVYVPMIEDIELKHVIQIKEGV